MLCDEETTRVRSGEASLPSLSLSILNLLVEDGQNHISTRRLTLDVSFLKRTALLTAGSAVVTVIISEGYAPSLERHYLRSIAESRASKSMLMTVKLRFGTGTWKNPPTLLKIFAR